MSVSVTTPISPPPSVTTARWLLVSRIALSAWCSGMEAVSSSAGRARGDAGDCGSVAVRVSRTCTTPMVRSPCRSRILWCPVSWVSCCTWAIVASAVTAETSTRERTSATVRSRRSRAPAIEER